MGTIDCGSSPPAPEFLAIPSKLCGLLRARESPVCDPKKRKEDEKAPTRWLNKSQLCRMSTYVVGDSTGENKKRVGLYACTAKHDMDISLAEL